MIVTNDFLAAAAGIKDGDFQRGFKIVFGVREPKPIIGAPAGRQRLRMRNTSTARLFVKSETGIRSFALIDMGHHWYCDPKLEQGRNVRQNGN